MSKIKNSATSTVIKFEFLRQIKKPSFWISIILIPILMFGVGLFSYLISSDTASIVEQYSENSTIAIVDDASLLPKEAPFLIDGDLDTGVEMVKDQTVDLFFYIPADFATAKNVEFYHISEGIDIFGRESSTIKAILSQYLSQNLDESIVTAITGNFAVTDNPLTSTGEPSNALGRAIIPLAFLIIFFLFVCLFGNRLLMTVVEEKENRISEMILTSVSAKHLIVGKIIAMCLLGIIQILAFVVPAVVLIFLFRDDSTISQILSLIELDPLNLLLTITLFAFSILFIIGACTFIGSISPTARDASQFIAPVMIGTMFPLYFMQSFFVQNPSIMVEFLTYFPFSAPIALMLRSAFGTLATPQLLIGIAEVAILSILIVYATIRSFIKNAINFNLALPAFLTKKS
ncbi:ABC transporter permease [Candidatus Saccharibacteria bacterium]|nr:ABC transporter permease [Candidatus Saccharibacteria bacterium]